MDWLHEDFAQATATTGNSNIWYNLGEDAWTDKSDPTTGNGIDDDGNGYIDDWLGWNMIDNTNDVTDNYSGHGTGVASVVAARPNNYTGMAGIAGGWGDSAGCQVMIVKVLNNSSSGSDMSTVLDDAILYAAENNARIINISLGAQSNTAAIEASIESAYNDYNCFLVAASGNDMNGTSQPVLFPANHPLVMSVANSNQNNVTQMTHTGPKLDLAAPGHTVPVMKPGDTYINQVGSSLSSPLTAGTAALMLSVNPCLNNEELGNVLKSTAEKTGSFDYNHDPDRPGHSLRMGYGRLNTRDAVNVAENMHSTTLDLYMKDRDNDFGYPNSYPFAYYFDNSPDIWVRELSDGYTNQIHQSPEYDSLVPANVYVKVRNKSCVPSTGSERLRLHWSKASSNASWPQNWDGTQPLVGNVIGDVAIPVLQAGEDTILHFSWTIIPEVGQNEWGTCLLARIISVDDPITVYPGLLESDVYENNNIAMRNLTIVDVKSGKKPYVHNGIAYPPGRHMYMGDSDTDGDDEGPIDVYFEVPESLSGPAITEVAEVTLRLDAESWSVFEQSTFGDHQGISILDHGLLGISGNQARLSGLNFSEGQRGEAYLGFNFLTDEVDSKTSFFYHVSQRLPDHEDKLIGAMHFRILREDREDFQANAGPDYIIEQNQSVNPVATDILEPATYNWYNSEDSLIYTGRYPNLSPTETEAYTLEVIADADQYKDYDEMRVLVNPYAIKSITPNPTSSNIVVHYDAEEASQAYLLIFPISNPSASTSHAINTSDTQTLINCSNYASGAHTILLVCDNQIVDSEILIKQ